MCHFRKIEKLDKQVLIALLDMETEIIFFSGFVGVVFCI